MDYNILIADFAGKNRICMTDTLYQYDYGQKLQIVNIAALPQTFEAHFSNVQHGGVSITVTGMDGIVDIPNSLLMTGKRIYCWIYVTEPGSGETEYQVLIPVQARPMPEYYDVTDVGVFDSVVQQVGDYAATATAGATSATASAAAAATSEANAAASASAAETAKNAAETAQGKAEDAQAAAETAAQTATEKAQQTAQDAAQTAQSKLDAESAAQRAEAAQTGAESAKTNAETAAQGAAASASAASASASSAGQAATSATQSATAAAQSAASIEGDVQIASQKAAEAEAAADQAVAAKDSAQTAQQGAEAAETNAGQSASTATTKATEAAQSATDAAASKTAAEAAATRAETAAASLTVDSALSDSSVNPVQNKVITGEVTQVKSHLNAFEYYTYTDDDLTTDNSYIGITDGALRNGLTNFHNSKLMTIPEGASTIQITKSGPMTGGAAVAFYTGYKFSSTTYISGVTIPDISALPISVPIPQNAVYMAFTGRKSNPFEAVLNTNKVAVDTQESINGVDLRLAEGSIDSNGVISYGATTISNYISKLLPKSTYKSIRIIPNRGYLCKYAFYENGSFVSRGNWVNFTGVLDVSNEHDIFLLFACEVTASKTADEMLAEYNIQIIASNELQTVYGNIDFAQTDHKRFSEHILSAVTCGKIIHYSLDDSYRALRRLITEESTYNSIFDNYIFGKLKTVHDQTGAKFTMNVILHIEDFDITLVPTKFMADFQANSDWLKFAYHDVDGDHSETTYEAMAAAYQTFVYNVYRFTGTYDCIDTMPRLDGFVGNINVVKAMQDNNAAPIVGLLSADDARDSYYLSSTQSAIAKCKGKYFDYDNNMVFIRSATRLDSASAAELIAEIEGNPCYQNFVEVWFHEGLVGDPTAEKLLTIGAWANSKGYNNYYPYKIFNF